MQRQKQFIVGSAPLYDKDEDDNIIYERVVGGFTSNQVANFGFDESGIRPWSPLHQYTSQYITHLNYGQTMITIDDVN